MIHASSDFRGLMHTITIRDFDDWRSAARRLLAQGVPPEQVTFRAHDDRQQPLFGDEEDNAAPATSTLSAEQTTIRVPPAFLKTARLAACHSDPGVWRLLYRLLWRLTRGERELLSDAADDDVRRLEQLTKQVTRDAHKMKAFVRFRRLETPEGERYVAWHRPDHRVTRLVAPFFARRFSDMDWTILTPHESVRWDGADLLFGPGAVASDAPSGDELEAMWRTYYRSTFNPARIKLAMMRREMPVRHWQTLPETAILPELLAEAPSRVAEMLRHAAGARRSVAQLLPVARDLASLARAAADCQACDLCQRATQTVFGSGSATARLMLVGEQPGDEEDRRGQVFVGPAGEVLRQAVADAGLDWQQLYVTNAVKHFHWTPRGTRRMHQRPPSRAVAACHDWLAAETAAVAPQVIVCLGATAGQSVLVRDNRLQRQRGVLVPSLLGPRALLTWHPAAILRAATDAQAETMRRELIAHLRVAVAHAS